MNVENPFVARKEEDLIEENQGGSIVYRLAALLKNTEEEVHKGFLEPDIFLPVKFYYWFPLKDSARVFYNRYPLFSVAPWDGFSY